MPSLQCSQEKNVTWMWTNILLVKCLYFVPCAEKTASYENCNIFPFKTFISIHSMLLIIFSSQQLTSEIFNFIILGIWVLWLYVCLYTTCMPGTQESQRRALNSWNWSYREVVSHQVFAGNPSQGLWKTASTLDSVSIFPGLTLEFPRTLSLLL